MAEGGFFARHPSVQALAVRDFRLLLAGTLLGGLVVPVQFITLIFWVQKAYPDRDVVLVTAISACRGFGMLAFSFAGGAIADRFERRHVLVATESVAFVLTAAVALAMLAEPLGEATIVAVAALVLLQAGNQAIDLPARAASIPAIVGMEAVTNAIGLQMVALQIAFPSMLPLVGFLNSQFESGRVFLGTAAVWVVVIPLMLALRFESGELGARGRGMLANIRDGLAYARRDATIFGVVGMVVLLQVVGMPGVSALGPVWMTDVLGLSKTEFGFMAMTWGIGAVSASLFFARLDGLARRGLGLCANVVLFAAAVIVFGHSRFIPLTVIANFSLGFGLVGTTVGATTIVQHLVSDEMRGRVMALFPLSVGLGMLSALPAGLAGQSLSLEVVVPAMGWLMLVLAAVIIVLRPNLRATVAESAAAARGPVHALEPMPEPRS
ncbi:MAG: MFS transporter [Chloroflexi bacterium]|nr:MFS transporter [Chloroflexota bacterium]